MSDRRKPLAACAFTTAAALALAASAVPTALHAAPAAACDPGRDGCFILLALTIDGVTAYPLRDLAPLYADDLARPITQADLVAVAQAITDKYRADGYFLSRAVVPPQGADPRYAHIRVYEGYIGEVQVTGDAAPALESLLAGLTEKKPVKLADLERRLTLANDLPGVKARTRLEPVIDDPARHRLVVDAGLQRWTASLYLDNRGVRAVGPDQAYLRAGANSVVRAGDQLTVSALTVPSDPGEIVQGEVSYAAALPNGARMRAAASASRSRPGATPLNNTVGTESRAFSLRWAYPLVRARTGAVWAAVNLDARHVEQSYFSGGGYSDNLSVIRTSLQATHSEAASSTNLFVQASRGLEVFGASRSEGYGRSRYDADGEFWKLNAGAAHYQDVGSRAGLYLSADAQWAPDALLLSEEFAPGGLPYGRAYNYAEISGDSGIAGLAEFRVGWNPHRPPLTFFQTYAFLDGAKVWNTASALGDRTAAIASTGAGLRLTFRDRVTLRMEAARPLSHRPWETGSRDWRGFVSLWAEF